MKCVAFGISLLIAGNSLAVLLPLPPDTPFTTLIRTESTVLVRTGDAPARIQKQGASLVSDRPFENAVSTSGNETSPCSDAGRRSLGESSTSSRASTNKDGALEIVVGIRTFAQGGHVRQCAGCIQAICVGPSGVDTKAEASADAQLSAEISFNRELPRTAYTLVVTHSIVGNGVDRTIEVIDNEGMSRPVSSGEQIQIRGGGGRSFRLEAKIKAMSIDGGGCCQDERKGTFQARVILYPSYRLSTSGAVSANRVGPSGAPEVGLLVTRGKRGEPVPVCTGTVVGQHTILTAAHCLEVYSSSPDLLFVAGDSLRESISRAVKITDWVRPSDESENGYRYRLENGHSIDDIALLYTNEPIGIKPGQLIQRPLSDGDLISSGGSAELVTFTTVDGSGVKFTGEDASKVDSKARLVNPGPKTVQLVPREQSLCAGWSGAPIISVMNHRLVILGIAISGAADCAGAEALRLDAYWPWLATRIR
jgi:hypothetical protein